MTRIENYPPELINHLPNSAKELASVGGLDATIALVNFRGGRRITFPEKPYQNHFLVSVIGFDAFRAFCRHYASEEVEIPTCQAAKTWLLGQSILADSKSGMSVAQLAEKYGCSVRTIYATRKRLNYSV